MHAWPYKLSAQILTKLLSFAEREYLRSGVMFAVTIGLLAATTIVGRPDSRAAL